MNNKFAIGISILILAGGGYFIYKEIQKKNGWKFDKATAVEFIVFNGYAANADALKNFDEGYVIAWAKAIGNKKYDFTYNGSQYNVAGGKKIQK